LLGVLLILFSGIFSAGCMDTLSGGTTSSVRANTTGDLRVYFLDAGQGDSSLILFKDKVILIDTGAVDQGERVSRYLQNLGVTRIDLLVATHPHSDNIGGMQTVLAQFPVKKVLDSGLPSTSALYEHFLETVDRKNIPYSVAEQGQTIDLDPSLTILVLSPPKERLDKDLNANSIILKISYGTISFLFTGDAGTVAEQALMRTVYSPEAQVLKIAHHGSSDATSGAFLSRVRPEVAVLSLSGENPYGYPHKETLESLQTAVPSIYRTDRDGTILIQSDGVSYSVITENGDGGIMGSSSQPYPATSRVTIRSTVSPSYSPPAAVTIPAFPPNITFPALPTIPSNVTLPELPAIPSVQIGNASFVKIDAVQFNAPGDDRENLNGEWVRLNNRGDETVLIAGWTLSDQNGGESYNFPAFILQAGRSVTVYTGSGEMNDTSLYMGKTQPLWGNSGDEAIIRDGSGNVIDRRTETSLS
jgi:beta-lactamase superfamily II metal-dependent hydrolase